MKIVLYACVPDYKDERSSKVRRARVTVDIGDMSNSPFKEYWAEVRVDYLDKSEAHDSCCHGVTFDASTQLSLDFVSH